MYAHVGGELVEEQEKSLSVLKVTAEVHDGLGVTSILQMEIGPLEENLLGRESESITRKGLDALEEAMLQNDDKPK
jgi:hypothetical protein